MNNGKLTLQQKQEAAKRKQETTEYKAFPDSFGSKVETSNSNDVSPVIENKAPLLPINALNGSFMTSINISVECMNHLNFIAKKLKIKKSDIVDQLTK